jgi:type IV secretion system protein VirB6
MAFACAVPPPDQGMVQNLLASVDCNVRGLSEAGYGALAAGNSPMSAILTLMLTLYIAFVGYRMLVGRTPLRVGDLTVGALKIGAVLALATSWPTYQPRSRATGRNDDGRRRVVRVAAARRSLRRPAGGL